MADELWANPHDVLHFIDSLRITSAPDEVPKPDLGSVLASAQLTTLANRLNELPGIVQREIGRFADIVTTAMIDVVDADQIVPPPGDEDERRTRDMTAYWATHGDVVEHGLIPSGFNTYDDVGDDFSDALRNQGSD